MNNKNNKGQSLVEYIALTALVAIVSVGTVKVFGNKVQRRLNQITNTFDRNMQQGLKSRHSNNSDDDEEGGQRGKNRFPFPLPF